MRAPPPSRRRICRRLAWSTSCALLANLAILLCNTAGFAQNAYIAGPHGIAVIDTVQDTVRTTIPLDQLPINLAAVPNRSKVYVTSYRSDQVYVIDACRNLITATFSLGRGTQYLDRPMIVAPDARRIYELDGKSAKISVIDVAGDGVLSTIGVGDHPRDLALSADGARLYVVNQFGNSVSVIDTPGNKVTATIAVDTWPYHALLAPDGRWLYVAHFSSAQQVSVIDTAHNAAAAKITVGGWYCWLSACTPENMAITPDGRKLYVTVPESKHLAVIDTGERRVTGTINVGEQKLDGNSLAITPDGRTLYVSSGSGTVSAIDTTKDAVVAAVPAAGALSITPDGKKIYAVGDTVSVIDATTSKLLATIPTSGFHKVAFAGGR